MLPDDTVKPGLSILRRIRQVLAGCWQLILMLGFFAIGPVISFVGLQSPIVTLALSVFLILGGLCLQTDRRLGLPIAPLALAVVALFLLVAGASLYWTPDMDAAERQLIQFAYTLLPIACAIGVLMRLPDRLVRRLEWAFIAGILIGMTILVFEVKEGQPLHYWVQGLKPGELSINTFNRALVGMAMLVFPTVGLVLARGQNNLAIVIPVGYGALLTQTESQTALLGVAVGAIVYVLAVRLPKFTPWMVGGIFVALSIGAVPVAFAFDASGLVHADWLMLSARHRIEVWHFAAEKIMAAPWLGYGLESAQATFPKAGEISSILPHDINMVHRHPHNLFLQIWYEFGALGAAVVMIAGLAMLWRLSKLAPRAGQAGIATFSACLAMVAVTSFSIWHTWFMCTLALALFSVLLLARDPLPVVKPSVSTGSNADDKAKQPDPENPEPAGV